MGPKYIKMGSGLPPPPIDVKIGGGSANRKTPPQEVFSLTSLDATPRPPFSNFWIRTWVTAGCM